MISRKSAPIRLLSILPSYVPRLASTKNKQPGDPGTWPSPRRVCRLLIVFLLQSIVSVQQSVSRPSFEQGTCFSIVETTMKAIYKHSRRRPRRQTTRWTIKATEKRVNIQDRGTTGQTYDGVILFPGLHRGRRRCGCIKLVFSVCLS